MYSTAKFIPNKYSLNSGDLCCNFLVRLTQLDNDNCVVEGTVDGLSPGQHGLAIHETGDTSEVGIRSWQRQSMSELNRRW